MLQSLPAFSLLVLGGDDGSPCQNSSLRCFFELLGISIPKIRDLFKGSHHQKPPFLLFAYKDLPFFHHQFGECVCFAATKQANLRFRSIFLLVLGDHCGQTTTIINTAQQERRNCAILEKCLDTRLADKAYPWRRDRWRTTSLFEVSWIQIPFCWWW